MTDEQFAKKRYVEENLIQAVKPLHPDLNKLEYWVHAHEEYVSIYLRGSLKIISITDDSLLAIAKDVLTGIERGCFCVKKL